MNSLDKIAIANRGEVAVRIINACRELGIKTVLLHSEADAHSRAWRMADERVCIGPAPTSESYLQIERNVEGALSAGAQAVHPGFGFLSENSSFARACDSAGLVFVGPKAETIEALGNKISAKRLIDRSKVPTVPGYMGTDQRIDILVEEAARIGFPVIVKAAAGGGGRGMKVLRNRQEAFELIASAQREAESAFGSPVVFLEKYLDRAKHIEFQVFGDFTGRCVHLFERECTVQRRHQKIIEEAQSATLSPELRAEMGRAAVALTEQASYRGAGTVEFLVQDEKFYFLEMNTRLQVEHPVTEMILGVDLVKAQILTAAQQFVLWRQQDLIPRGHSIECRVYAEDPYNRGLPSTGEIVGLEWPQGPGRRFESGVDVGDEVTPYYDSMIAKLIVWDEDRPRAIRKMRRVIDDTVIFGVRTNLPYLRAILDHQDFTSGQMTTQFISQYFAEGLEPRELTREQLEFARKALPHAKRMKSSVAGLGSVGAAVGGGAGQFIVGQARAPWMGNWRLV